MHLYVGGLRNGRGNGTMFLTSLFQALTTNLLTAKQTSLV